MSLGLIVLRQLTVLALTGKTLAGDSVGSSAVASVDAITEGQTRPAVTVFTDKMAERDEASSNDSSFFSGHLDVTLALEIVCLSRGKIDDTNDEEIFIPSTDEGLEITIDLIQYVALAELDGGDGPWSELWRKFVLQRRVSTVERGASADKASRFAARRIELSVGIIADPVPGEELELVWLEIVEAFEAADDELIVKLGTMIRAMVETGSRPKWRTDAAWLGLSPATANSIGIGPSPAIAADEVVTATEIVAEDKDRDTEVVANDED